MEGRRCLQLTKPVLGILTLYLNQYKHLEEQAIYEKMIAASNELCLDVYVFTPQDVHEHSQKIYALRYDLTTKRWIRKWCQFPHMIFDRCRFQNSYRFQQLCKFRQKNENILFLNRPLRNKWSIYHDMYKNSLFKEHLPKTYLYCSIRQVQSMLRTYPFLYIKPINGTGGRGILRLERIQKNPLTVIVQGRNHERCIIRPQRLMLQQLAKKLLVWRSKRQYLIQQGIPITLSNGRVHDYRMLVQKDGYGKWNITGCVGRIGANNSVTSNLHGGGTAMCMNDLLAKWIKDGSQIINIKSKINHLSLEIAKFLEQKYGALCELALDFAIDQSGQIWLLEVNPKPAREVFQRIGDHATYHLAITRPLEYALWLYKQQQKQAQHVAIRHV